jgi:hypothetical protein
VGVGGRGRMKTIFGAIYGYIYRERERKRERESNKQHEY